MNLANWSSLNNINNALSSNLFLIGYEIEESESFMFFSLSGNF